MFKRLAPATSVLSSFLAIVCPLCIPAFGALLASIGLGFAVNFQFLRGLVVALLLISLCSLGWSARVHKHWRIFFCGALGAVWVYAGRYVWYSVPVMLIGALTLISASVWNLKAKVACQACDGDGKH
jgi:hypothetical protein